MSLRPPYWVIAAMVTAAVASVVSMSYRYRVEQLNKRVGISLEMRTVHDIAAASGLTVKDTLLKLRAQGLTGVAISEQAVTELLARGEIERARVGALTVFKDLSPEPRVENALIERFGYDALKETPEGFAFPAVPMDAILAAPVGLDPADSRAAVESGIAILARHENAPGSSMVALRGALSRSHRQGADFFLPQGDQVLGQRELLPFTAQSLREIGMIYVSPEFNKIAGDDKMTALSKDNMVRLHTIQASEMDKMSMPSLLERFQRAYRERGMRWLLLRPYSIGSQSALAGAEDLVRRLADGLRKEGGTIGVPKRVLDSMPPKPLFPIIGVSAAIVGFWVLSVLFPVGPVKYLLGALLLALGVACWTYEGARYMATVAAMIFPVAAYIALESFNRPNVLGSYLLVSAISFIGGLCVAGLLNNIAYFVRADQFFAVKLAHFLPIVVIGGFLLSRRVSLTHVLQAPARWGAILASLVLLSIIGLMLLRTGNDNPAAVSGLELKLREVLDAVFFARPRTKEFLFGHPAMIVGLFLLARSKSTPKLAPAAALMLTLGAVGQTSIVNTLCHLHTPLDLNLLRIAIGLIVGGAIGLVLWWMIRPFLPRLEPQLV